MNFAKLCLLSLVLISSSVFASSEGHIISASSNSSLDFTESKKSDGYDAVFNIALGYEYAMTNGIQLGGVFGASIDSGSSVLLFGFGPGYNFSTQDIENSVFITAKVGVLAIHYDKDSSTSDTFVSAEVGKRFKILENVSYVPGLYIQKVLGSRTPDPSFSFEILRFSIIF